MSQVSAPRGAVGGLLRDGVVVTVANFAVNALAYLVPLLAARSLAPGEWGALATVMALLAIATVPGLGLQLAVAVARARGGSPANAGRLARLTAAATGGVVLLSTPLLAATLHLPVLAAVLLAGLAVPVVLASRWLGELQGAERFPRLAAGMVGLALARYAGIAVGLYVGAGLLGSLAAGVAVAWLAPPVLAYLGRDARTTGRPDQAPGTSATSAPLRARAIFTATSGTVAMLAVSYADLILARHLLAADASGAYAVGAVLTRGAIWAPQVFTLLLLPRLAQGRRHALGVGLALVGGAGVALVAATVVAPELAVRLAGGAQYADLAAQAPWFAALGALYALAFFLLNARIAAGAARPATPLWAGLAVLVATLLAIRPTTVGAVVTVALGVAALATAALGLGLRRDLRRRPSVEPPVAVVTEP